MEDYVLKFPGHSSKKQKKKQKKSWPAWVKLIFLVYLSYMIIKNFTLHLKDGPRWHEINDKTTWINSAIKAVSRFPKGISFGSLLISMLMILQRKRL